MQKDQYDSLLDRLRQNRPVSASDARLTDSIMERLSQGSNSRNRYIVLKANRNQWTLFTGIRKIMTAAAIFLVGFFIYQQWHINDKLNKLKDQVAVTQQYPAYNPKLNGDFQQVNYMLHSEALGSFIDSLQDEELLINRRSLNYLVKRIRQLENENMSYRDKLQQYSVDSNLNKP